VSKAMHRRETHAHPRTLIEGRGKAGDDIYWSSGIPFQSTGEIRILRMKRGWDGKHRWKKRGRKKKSGGREKLAQGRNQIKREESADFALRGGWVSRGLERTPSENAGLLSRASEKL